MIKNKESAFSVICIAILFVFFLAVNLVVFTRIILYEKLGIVNFYTRSLLSSAAFDDVALGSNTKSVAINWDSLYPFSHLEERSESFKSNHIARYLSVIQSVKNVMTGYACEHLFKNQQMTAWDYFYRKTVLWNYASSKSREVIQTSDGYLTHSSFLTDVKEYAESLRELASFCKKRDVLIAYFNVPIKVCKYDDKDINDTVCLSNRNADNFLFTIQHFDIDSYDLRELIHKDNYSHHKIFYRTDHHWRLETGRWAAQKIAELLNTNNDFTFDLSVLNSELFFSKTYPNCFYGSHARKGLIPVEKPEDYLLYYPNFKTEFHYEIMSLGIDQIGDFSIFYGAENPDGAYSVIHGNQPLERIENKMINNSIHALIVHDSFGNVVVPFFSLCCRYVDSIDLRAFNGSLQNYIETEKPDVVIVMYNSDSFNFNSRRLLFDFR